MLAISPNTIRQLHSIMVPEPIDQLEWYEVSDNVTDLLQWLYDNDRINWNITDVCYFLTKPYKWDREWKRMQAERQRAIVNQKS